MSEEDKRKCYNCLYYKAYYTKGYYKFDKCDRGICARTKEQKDKHDSCMFFGWEHYFRKDNRELALRKLAENIDVLTQIKQIIEDDREE